MTGPATAAATAPGQRDERDRSVYVREDELLHDLATMLRENDGAPDLTGIPPLLRTQQITNTCARSRRTLTRAQPQPAPQGCRSPSTPYATVDGPP